MTTQGLSSFLKSVSTEPADYSIELFISLVKRRQIRGSRACALATAYLLRRVISLTRGSEPGRILHRVQDVGRRLINAAPRELAIGNVVRRILGLIRDEEEENRGDDAMSRSTSDLGSEAVTPRNEVSISSLDATLLSGSIASRRDQDVARPPLLSAATGTSRPMTSMFSISSHPTMLSGTASPALRSGTSTPGVMGATDLRAETLEGISEIIDELDQADEQIANYALEHIYPTETVFVYGSSQTVQRFLLKAASKRKFTVIHAESYPNGHSKSHSLATGNPQLDPDDDDTNMPTDSFQKPLIAAGVTVLLVPDSATFAMMSRASKVVLSAHAVLSNGSIVASAGTKAVIKAAKFHRVSVLVLAATFKLSPLYPNDPYDFVEYGDVGRVIEYQDSELREGLSTVRNPISDFIGGDEGLVDLFVTNVGAVSLGYLYRVVRDQYRDEDVKL